MSDGFYVPVTSRLCIAHAAATISCIQVTNPNIRVAFVAPCLVAMDVDVVLSACVLVRTRVANSHSGRIGLLCSDSAVADPRTHSSVSLELVAIIEWVFEW